MSLSNGSQGDDGDERLLKSDESVFETAAVRMERRGGGVIGGVTKPVSNQRLMLPRWWGRTAVVKQSPLCCAFFLQCFVHVFITLDVN